MLSSRASSFTLAAPYLLLVRPSQEHSYTVGTASAGRTCRGRACARRRTPRPPPAAVQAPPWAPAAGGRGGPRSPAARRRCSPTTWHQCLSPPPCGSRPSPRTAQPAAQHLAHLRHMSTAFPMHLVPVQVRSVVSSQLQEWRLALPKLGVPLATLCPQGCWYAASSSGLTKPADVCQDIRSTVGRASLRCISV